MRKTLLLALAIVTSGVLVGIVQANFHPSRAETAHPGTIAASDAAEHVGQSIIVEGTVSEVHVANNATFIDIGGQYPGQEFTAVIFPESYGAFRDVAELQGKRIDISGTVQLYGERPEIVLTSAGQIRSE